MKEKILGEYNGWQWAQSTYSGTLLASVDCNVSKIILLPPTYRYTYTSTNWIT